MGALLSLARKAAKVATVSVANLPEAKADPSLAISATEENAIRAWLESIGEYDPLIIGETLTKCRVSPDALRFFLGLARGEDTGCLH